MDRGNEWGNALVPQSRAHLRAPWSPPFPPARQRGGSAPPPGRRPAEAGGALHINGMDAEFEKRITWDAESLAQLTVLNPQDRPSAYRALIDKGTAMLSEAIAEAAAEKERAPEGARPLTRLSPLRYLHGRAVRRASRASSSKDSCIRAGLASM